MVLNLFSGSQDIYHTQNSGVERRFVFEDEKDLKRFIETLSHYKPAAPSSRFAFRKRSKPEREKDNSPLVEIVGYCLMPNHFHLILKELKKDGVSSYLSKVSNSYTKYFNARHKRSGALFKGRFKSVKLEKNQIRDVLRFIHLEPLIKKIVSNLEKFPFSSYYEIINDKEGVIEKAFLLSFFPGINGFTGFTLDTSSYEESLENIKNLTLD